MDIPGPESTAEGMIVADLDDGGLMDYLVTVPGHIAAYANDGGKLWVKKTDVSVGAHQETEGLPGSHGPGVQAADVDRDGETEVLYLTRDGALHAVDGSSGREKWKATPPVPEGAQRWEHLIIADFRGKGDRDLLLQATNTRRYRTAPFLAAYRVADLRRRKFRPLWTRDDFAACAHNGARVADLDGDGRDEVLG
jgi:outer membrane protein assembly factor BamB